MKAILFALLLASLAVNAMLLGGCASVSAILVNAPEPFKDDILEKNREGILVDSKDQFDRQQSFLLSLEGKTVIAIEPEMIKGLKEVKLILQKP